MRDTEVLVWIGKQYWIYKGALDPRTCLARLLKEFRRTRKRWPKRYGLRCVEVMHPAPQAAAA